MRLRLFLSVFIGLWGSLSCYGQDAPVEASAAPDSVVVMVSDFFGNEPDSSAAPKGQFVEKWFRHLSYGGYWNLETELPAVHYRNYMSRTVVLKDLTIGTLGATQFQIGVPQGTWFSDFNAVKQEGYPTYFRKGPIPSVEWTYQSSQGRGQYFELNATAPQSAYKYWNVHYGRLQAQGQLYNERYGADQLIVMHEARDSANTWEFKCYPRHTE